MTDLTSDSLRWFAAPEPGRRVKVAISVKARRPSGECLKRLESHGLTVVRTIGNKILGSVSHSNRDLLAARRDGRRHRAHAPRRTRASSTTPLRAHPPCPDPDHRSGPCPLVPRSAPPARALLTPLLAAHPHFAGLTGPAVAAAYRPPIHRTGSNLPTRYSAGNADRWVVLPILSGRRIDGQWLVIVRQHSDADDLPSA